MKYNTFVKLRTVGCLAVIAAPVALWVMRAKNAPPAPVSAVAQAATRLEGEPNTMDGLSEVDREVLRMQKQPLSNGTKEPKGYKWRVKKGGIVIELRCDTDKGYTTWNRAKVDANNNKQFDETWAFKKDGTVERRVAPNDDQNYTQTFRLKGEKWVRK